MVRVRFAPSPTGFLHVGNARTALFNFLFARHHGGTLVLRVEDTDLERSSKESEKQQLDTLRWLGFDWDEGPEKGGDFGPYRQSERLDLYRQVAHRLVAQGKAYEAFVYPEELEQMRQQLLEKKESPHYSFEMMQPFDTPERRREFASRGMEPVIYFKMPRKDFRWVDLIKGAITFQEGTIGDFVILRSNGMPIYNFSVVVDDALMQISHVIRGDDHVSNTLRQLALYEAMEYQAPFFAHVSTILGPDGSRLSKRHGATSIESFREAGFLPQCLNNYLALLGWSHPDGEELFSMEKMVEQFSLERVSSNPAVFDREKLTWMNGVYIRAMDEEALFHFGVPYLEKLGYMDQQTSHANEKWVKEALKAVQKEIRTLEELPPYLHFFFDEPVPTPDLVSKVKQQGFSPVFSLLAERVESMDDWELASIMSVFKEVLKETGSKPKGFYPLLREVLTGQDFGPELVHVVHLLGRNKVLQRVERLVNLF
ncbi:MAG TPA: glutamate--tRNA ligase [Thermotogota bacterium]|nr:glutamate--tRNA ligase [Thermotogota bacterium]HRW91828.1 glutamate--tRNA ligase [Thermotogota bacterium]